MKYLFIIVLSTIAISCRERGHQRAKPIKMNTQASAGAASNGNHPLFVNVDQVVSDTGTTHWGNYTGKYSSLLHFNLDNKDTLCIEFYNELWGAYPIKTKNDKIIVYWDKNLDAKYNFDLVKAINKIPNSYTGKPFLILALRNDSTLNAQYFYPDLKERLNKADTDIIVFPQEFIARSLK